VLAQRAASEDPRWTRAVGIIPATPYYVIARCGLADGLFEHSATATAQLLSAHVLISAHNDSGGTFAQALSRIYECGAFNHTLGRFG